MAAETVTYESPWDGEAVDQDRRNVALVGHDNMKSELAEWAVHNRDVLAGHTVYATGSTGRILSDQLGIPVRRFLSGPLGGDQQIGACIAQGTIDALIFFWDPLQPQPHDTDVKALLRVATLWNIPVASNRATADMIITSPLFSGDYRRVVPPFLRSATDPTRCVP